MTEPLTFPSYICKLIGKPCNDVPWNGYKPCQCEECQKWWYYAGTDE